jgi:methylmalonyl-CoA/ethylmalonyl-CoA epimerase
MIEKLDHVGLAIQNTEEVAALLAKLFGFEIKESREEPQAGFKSTLISKEEVTLELIQPVGPQGMIQKFIEKRGAGLHHISIRVDDLDAEMRRLKELGVQFASEEPAKIDDTKVIFIHPRSASGLLVELIQRN